MFSDAATINGFEKKTTSVFWGVPIRTVEYAFVSSFSIRLRQADILQTLEGKHFLKPNPECGIQRRTDRLQLVSLPHYPGAISCTKVVVACFINRPPMMLVQIHQLI